MTDEQSRQLEIECKIRRLVIELLAAGREVLEERHGRVWDTDGLKAEFDIKGFLAPYVVVQRKSDGVIGSLEFQHSPRFYFNWQEDK